MGKYKKKLWKQLSYNNQLTYRVNPPIIGHYHILLLYWTIMTKKSRTQKIYMEKFAKIFMGPPTITIGWLHVVGIIEYLQ